MSRARCVALVAVAGMSGLAPACAGSSVGRQAAPPLAAPAGAIEGERFVLDRTSGGTTVSAAVVVPGSVLEDADSTGIMLLAARTILEDARPQLEAMGASVGVVCTPAAFTFWMTVPEETWQPATTTFMSALFQADPSTAALNRARTRLRASMALDRSNPAWQARLGVRRALHGDPAGSPWTRPACGLPELLPFFDLDAVGLAAERFRPDHATAALTGPFQPDTAARLFRATFQDGAGAAVAPAPPPARPARVYIERNTVTAWLSLAWRFGEGTNPEAVRLLGALLRDAVAPGVQQPDVFHVSAGVERFTGGGALVLHLVVAPGSAESLADTLETLTAAAARGATHPAVLERVRRRHLGTRLRELETPESRVIHLALEHAFGMDHTRGAGSPGWPAIGAMGPESVRSAAAALAPPARSVVGPREARPAVVP